MRFNRLKTLIVISSLGLGLHLKAQNNKPEKLVEVETYLGKTIGYPKPGSAPRTNLQAEYDKLKTKTTLSQEEQNSLNTKLQAFRNDKANVLFPSNGKVYTFKVLGIGKAANSTDEIPNYLYNENGNNGNLRLTPQINTNSKANYYFRLDAGADATKFSLFNIGTNKYLNQKKASTNREVSQFTAEGDGRFTFHPTTGTSRNKYVGWKTKGNQSYSQIDQWGASTTQKYIYWQFEEIPLKMVVIKPNIPGAKGKYTWNNQTFKNSLSLSIEPATYQVTTSALTAKSTDDAFLFQNFTNNGAVVTSLSDVSNGATIVANFKPNFYSTTYGEKWIRINFAKGANNAWCLNAGDNFAGLGITNKPIDLSEERFLWCFVGDSTGFKIYNKASGENYAVTIDGEATNATEVKLADASTAKTWVLGTDHFGASEAPGYYFKVQGSSSQYAPNSYGGDSGFPIKCWHNYGAGSHWTISGAGIAYTLKLTIPNLPATIPNTQNRIGSLNASVDGTNVNLQLKATEEATALYLPKGTSFTLRAGNTYRNFRFVNIKDKTHTNGVNNLSIDEVIQSDTISIHYDYTNSPAHYVFYNPDEKGIPFRIPAITVAPNGDIIAISDYRYNKSDIGYGNGMIDLVARVSKDNGNTWDSIQTVVKHGNTNITKGYGDAALVADRMQNKALVMAVAGNKIFWNSTPTDRARVVRIEGVYNANTGAWEWSAPEDQTDHFYQEVYKGATLHGMFFSSGRLMQSKIVRKGEYYRIYGVIAGREGRRNIPTDNRVVYTDDFGKTWQMLGAINDYPVSKGDEAKCEELPNGDIVVSSRAAGKRLINVFAFNRNNPNALAEADGRWKQQSEGIQYGNNACNGELFFVNVTRKSDGKRVLLGLHSVPTNGRNNVSIFYKEITANDTLPASFGQGWTQKIQLSHTGSAYSTMDLQQDGKLAFFLEEGGFDGGYDMVYFPISIDSITSGKYTLADTLTISETGYNTFFAPYPIQKPQAADVFTAVVEANKLKLTALEGDFLPAHTAFIVKGSPGEKIVYQEVRETASPIAENMLKAYPYTFRIFPRNEQSYFYTLGYENSEQKMETAGFFLPDSLKNNVQSSFLAVPYQVYLRVPNEVGTATKYLFQSEEPSSILPTLHNRQGIDVIHTLKGNRIEKPLQKGIYIINGKKQLIG